MTAAEAIADSMSTIQAINDAPSRIAVRVTKALECAGYVIVPVKKPEKPTVGYAAIRDDKIIVATVSRSRRAAIVNWLVVEGDMMVHAGATDDYIERLWQSRRPTNVDISMVDITINPYVNPMDEVRADNAVVDRGI